MKHRPLTRRHLAIEPLEKRWALDARLLITEFVADNKSGLEDDDGDRSDWIEIRSDGDVSANLAGWYLTDNARNLRKWQFPSVEITPYKSRIVFASGKNRAVPNSPLHSNFKLDSEGEYLALVRPDGTTIEHGYTSPGFPPQKPDTSFGLPQPNLVDDVLGSEYPVRVLVPTQVMKLGNQWQQTTFDDSSWLAGKGNVGYSPTKSISDLIQFDVREPMQNINSSIYIRIPFDLSEIEKVETFVLRFRYDDGFVAYLNGNEIGRRSAPVELNETSKATANRGVIEDVLTIDEFDLLEHRDYLKEGKNVLAIHGLNQTVGNVDFLFAPELLSSKSGQANVTQHRFFGSPSPLLANGLVSYADWLSEPTVSVQHGFFDGPQGIAIQSADVGATLVYTTDGSVPSAANGIQVPPASDNVRATTEFMVDRTTTLRVASIQNDRLNSGTVTNTYLFLDDVVQQSADGTAPPGWPTRRVNGQAFDYGMDPDIVNDPQWGPLVHDALLSLPSISIVTDLKHLFDPKTGIYVNAVKARGENDLWERPASVELIRPGGETGFQIDAGLRIRGGYSRQSDNPKHALRMIFGDEYGDGPLRYPFFDDEGAKEFKNIDLRLPDYWHWCKPGGTVFEIGCEFETPNRETFARDTQRDIGQSYTRSRYFHVYINGQYWGLLEGIERSEASYAATYFGGNESDYDVVKVESFPHRMDVTDGDLEAWKTLWTTAKQGFVEDAAYYRVLGQNPDGSRNTEYPVLVDVDNLIDYMLVIFYTGDLDAPISWFGDNAITNNWYGIRSRIGETGFRFFIHDADGSMLERDTNRLGPWPAGNAFDQSNPQWLHQRLMMNAEYRMRFADRAQKYLFNGGPMTPAASLARLGTRQQQLELAIIAESARWGDASRAKPYTKEDWLKANQYIRDIIDRRTEIVIDQLKDARLV